MRILTAATACMLWACTASTTAVIAGGATPERAEASAQPRSVPLGATSCGTAGGLCLGGGQACTRAGGTPLPQFDRDCGFDDGRGACCLPPAAAATGGTCADHGGLCAPVGGCLRDEVDGLFAPPPCGPPPMICCVPPSNCPGPRPVCCDATATFRPLCDRGAWRCLEGMRMEPEGSCD